MQGSRKGGCSWAGCWRHAVRARARGSMGCELRGARVWRGGGATCDEAFASRFDLACAGSQTPRAPHSAPWRSRLALSLSRNSPALPTRQHASRRALASPCATQAARQVMHAATQQDVRAPGTLNAPQPSRAGPQRSRSATAAAATNRRRSGAAQRLQPRRYVKIPGLGRPACRCAAANPPP